MYFDGSTEGKKNVCKAYEKAQCVDTSQFDQRGSYTKLPRRSYKFHQLCILSSTSQWHYPKY